MTGWTEPGTLVASLSPAPGPPPAQRMDGAFLTPSGRRLSWEGRGTPPPSGAWPWRKDSCLSWTDRVSFSSFLLVRIWGSQGPWVVTGQEDRGHPTGHRPKHHPCDSC